MSEILNYLIHEFESKFNITIQEGYYSHGSRLSTRSINIIGRMGGIEAMISHYKQYGKFSNIQNAGASTDIELCLFSEFLIRNFFNSDFTVKEKPEEYKPTADRAVDDETCMTLNERYQFQKAFLSVRAKNVMDNLEINYQYSLSDECKIMFIRKVFVEEFNFMTLRNIGEKTLKELNQLAHELNALMNNLPASDTELLRKRLEYKIRGFLGTALNDFNVEDLIVEEGYSILKLIPISILNIKTTNAQKEILIQLFFNNEVDFKEISEKVNCSTERVRQVLISFKKTKLPQLVSAIQSEFEGLPSDFPAEDFDIDFIACEKLPSVRYESKIYYPNSRLSQYVYAAVLEDKYLDFQELIWGETKERKSFVSIEEIIFASKEFAEQANIPAFIDWIDEQIYQFEIAEFEYDLKVLVGRFFSENNIIISHENLKNLTSIIQKIKKTDWSDIYNKIVKSRKKRKKGEIVRAIQEYIESSTEPLKTGSILEHLNSLEMEIDKEDLLVLLNKNKFLFKPIGTGQWSIKNSNNPDDIQGSLRDIVVKRLLESNDPIHISELVSFISQYRVVSLRSLLTNLKAVEYDLFRFLNCGFIGLFEKEYDDKWYKMPKVNPRHLMHNKWKGDQLKSIDEISNHLSEKYGYPVIHISYLLRERFGDGNDV